MRCKGYTLAVHPRIHPSLEIKHTRLDPLLLPLARLALTIKVPNRLRQRLRHIRMIVLQVIPHGVTAHQITLAALQRFCNTQQPHEIRVIGMKELSRISPVDAHLVNLCRIFAQVLDVSEHMAARVLRHEVAQISSETHVCYGTFAVAPFCDRHPFKEDEALAVDEFFAEGLEELAESRELEFLFGDSGQGRAAFNEGICCGGDFLNFG